MSTPETTIDTNSLEQLLAHGGWARRLAARLVHAGDADDLVQDTWTAAAGGRPVPAGLSPRKWLAGVMRNLSRLDRRTAARRQAREQAAGALVHGQGAASRPDEIAEQLETQRLLADLVLALAPIYRDVLLLRFYDELGTDEVAARLHVPPGTARRRLAMALAQLRGQLDARNAGAGSPRGWRRALALLAGPGLVRRAPPVAVRGLAAATAAAALGVVALLMVNRAPPPETISATAPVAGPPASGSPRPPRLAAAFAPAEDPDSRRTTSTQQTAPTARPSDGNDGAPAEPRYQIPLGTGPLRGPPDARVTILEFVDYQCPFTARAERALQAVLQRHAADVRFQVIHRPLEFHPQAALAARAALAADAQGRFWDLHARLLSRHRERWTPELLEQQARDAGLDVARFRRDLDSSATRGRLAIDEATATSAGIEGVPVFFVNGRVLTGADAPAQMPAVIAEELRRTNSLLAAGARRQDIYNAALAGGRPVLLQSRADKAERNPTREAVGGRRPDFERTIFSSSGSCAPPLEAPTALDHSFPGSEPGNKRRIMTWSLIAGGTNRYRNLTSADGRMATLRSTEAAPDDFMARHQSVLADAYRGKQVRFRAELKGDPGAPAHRWAGLWMRVEDAAGRVITSERAPLRPAERGWHPAAVTLAIPADAKLFSYGLLLAGPGEVSMRNLAVETVEGPR